MGLGLGALIGKGLSWLGGGSAAAKGLGTVATAVAPLFGKKGPSPQDQAYGQLAGAFKAADDYGLHRLAVAGSPAGYSPAPSNAAEGLLQAGQMMGQGMGKKQEELIDAQIEEARSRTLLNQANSRRALMGPQPGLGGVGGQTQQTLNRIEQFLAGGDTTGTREPFRNMPLGSTIRVGDKTYYYPNSEALETGLSELMAAGIILGPQVVLDAMQNDTQAEINRSKYNRPSRPGSRPVSRPRSAGSSSRRNNR